MKITEETKIKDLIPDGYEIEEGSSDWFNDQFYPFQSNEPTKKVFCLHFKKKKEKNFQWYVEKYLLELFNIYKFKFPSDWINKDELLIYYEDKFRLTQFYSIPFEIKIGLVKFICDDLEVNWKNLISFYNSEQIDSVKEVKKIIPKEFLESLFKK